ncbi:hypothetical protein [Pseudomonas sp. AM8]|uniref:hypothetical protein n=1 Tax=Pseudomonas sp. AM8 TaxID=2983368 RepID=UPI002E804D56|nr:hypothetical protein [Pseudomonas sp. AM8]
MQIDYRRTAALRRADHLANHKTVNAKPIEWKFDAKRPNPEWVTDVTEFGVWGAKALSLEDP